MYERDETSAPVIISRDSIVYDTKKERCDKHTGVLDKKWEVFKSAIMPYKVVKIWSTRYQLDELLIER